MKISNVTKIICSRWSLGLSGKRYTPQYCFWPPIYGHLSRKMMIDHQLLGAPKFQTNPSSKMGWWDVPNSQDGRWHWHWPKEQLEDLDDELATPSISVIRSLFTIQSSRAAGQQQGSRAAARRFDVRTTPFSWSTLSIIHSFGFFNTLQLFVTGHVIHGFKLLVTSYWHGHPFYGLL